MDFDALAPVAKLDGLARRPIAVDRSDQRAPVPQNPAEVLAQLMDFSGSVALAELLQAPLPTGPAHPDAAERAHKLQAKLHARLDALLPRALKPFGAQPVAGPEQLLETIGRVVGIPGRVPHGETVVRLARELGAPTRSALGKSVRLIRSTVSSLRSELAEELHELGPRAARLESIDAALQRSMQRKLNALFERMEFAAELSFERACSHACAQLPEVFGTAELAYWAADGGWLERQHERSVYVTKALFGHLKRSLEGLLSAAIEAEVGT